MIRFTQLLISLIVVAIAGFSLWSVVQNNETPLSPPIESAFSVTNNSPDKGWSVDIQPGNFLMIGHWSKTPVASTTELISSLKVGGVIIMDAPTNPIEIQSWTKEWQAASDIPLFIAIDQEGGPVTRLKGADFIQTGQQEIMSEAKAYDVGFTRGQELKALGINMNFAPVLDTSTNQDSFMYSRTFPSNTDAAKLAAAMSRGMSDAGVIAVAKHFPGHPDTTDDSHLTLPTVSITKTDLDSFTKPFAEYIEIAAPLAIMTAHVEFPNIDSKPATLSHYFLTDYLRNTLNFTGMIITDDMSMDAIDATWSTDEATVLSLEAGADLILFAAEPEKARSAAKQIEKEITNGNLSQAAVQEKIARHEKLLREI